jgi:hypothetical protein
MLEGHVKTISGAIEKLQQEQKACFFDNKNYLKSLT